MDFTVAKQDRDGVLVVSPRGEIDVYTAPELKEQAASAIEEGADRVVIDMSDVDFMDSSGLGVLVSLLKRVREAGGSIRLVIPDERILKIFRITALDEVFDIDPRLEDALALMGAS
jgi:anti-sigma B factor antagonist